MNFDHLKEALDDPRAGLFFLVGLDEDSDGTPMVLTVHAAVGMLCQEERDFLKHAIALHAPSLRLEVREHDADTLHEARSLQALAEHFAHNTILVDPTHSFARLTALLNVVRDLRLAFGELIDKILWEPHAARLLVVPGAMEEVSLETLKCEIEALVAKQVGNALDRVIASVELGQPDPARRYTPVDERALKRLAPVHRPRRKSGLRVHIAALAAMIGIGSMAAASTPQEEGVLDHDGHLPGIAAFVDLTALGESAFGTRSPFKAAGGLRLYFGETVAFTGASFDLAGTGYTVGTPKHGEFCDDDPVSISYGC